MIEELERQHQGNLKVVVLTCHDFGRQMAFEIDKLIDVNVLAIVESPLRKHSLPTRIRRSIRKNGILGTLGRYFEKVVFHGQIVPSQAPQLAASEPCRIPIRRFEDFHSKECLEFLRSLNLDLAIIDGTGILKAELFNLPRLGSINLHCGKLPEYRGAPPAFWELMNGESICGVSVHRVSDKLDEGAILDVAEVPLDRRPAGDPYVYVQKYWLEKLRPIGIQLVVAVVSQILAGTATAIPQTNPRTPVNKSPTYAEIRELRRKVKARFVTEDDAFPTLKV